MSEERTYRIEHTYALGHTQVHDGLTAEQAEQAIGAYARAVLDARVGDQRVVLAAAEAARAVSAPVGPLTYDQAVALLPEGERIHTFVNPAGMLLGADWDRADVLALLETAEVHASGPEATAMRHGLAAIGSDGKTVFVETRQDEEH